MPADPEGWRLGIWWPDDGQHYYGVVDVCDGGVQGAAAKHLVHYDDGARLASNPSSSGQSQTMNAGPRGTWQDRPFHCTPIAGAARLHNLSVGCTTV